jgi:hypothetical protein
VEPHGAEVLANAHAKGLEIVEVRPPRDTRGAIEAFAEAPRADVYNITSFMTDELISLFYSGADAVLANSGHEPFGLVGLEVMAAGGVVFVGTTGEDYAVPFLNCVAVDTDDPSEITIGLDFLRKHPAVVERMRRDAQETAESFSWANVVQDSLLGKLQYVAMRQVVTPPGESKPTVPGGQAGADEAASAATAPSPAAPTATAASETNAASAAYGGDSLSTRPSVKPRGSRGKS